MKKLTKKEIEKQEKEKFLEKINLLDLKWIKFELSKNNKIVPILNSTKIFSLDSHKLQLYLYIANKIAKNEKINVKTMVFYLEKSNTKRIKLLDILNKELKDKAELLEWFEDSYPFKIEELESEVKKDPYIVKDEEWNIRNLLFEFIEKVSNLTKFIFNKNYKTSIQRNMKTIKQWLLENHVDLKDLEWYFDNIYSKMVYDWQQHKSIKWFLLEAQEYFYNPDNYKKELKALLLFLKTKNESTKRLAVWTAFKKYKNTLSSILYHLDYNLDIFEKILKDFSAEYKRYWLNWTLNTLFNNLFQKYPQHIKNLEDIENKDNKIENKDNWYEKEFKDFVKLKWIDDVDIIKEYYNIYKKEWIQAIQEL